MIVRCSILLDHSFSSLPNCSDREIALLISNQILFWYQNPTRGLLYSEDTGAESKPQAEKEIRPNKNLPYPIFSYWWGPKPCPVRRADVRFAKSYRTVIARPGITCIEEA